MTLLLSLACVGPPAGIPDQIGSIDQPHLEQLASISSPDVPFLLWLTAEQLAVEDWRDCPTVFYRADGVTLRAGDCTDSTDIAWTGSLSTTWDDADQRLAFTFDDFGADAAGLDGWSVSGTMSVQTTDSGNGFLISDNLSLTSLKGEESTLFWVYTEAAYGTYDGTWYADHYEGQLGIEAWGTTSVRSTNVPLAAPYGCGWGKHASGEVLFGDQAGLAYATDDVTAVSLGFKGADTGAGDTGAGETGDSGGGDSGDSGPRDSGDSGDTPESGDSGTPPDDGGGDYEVPSFGNGGQCGTCVEGAIGDAWLEGCIEPANPFDWPFVAPF